jgi:hypothetical protein
VCVCVLLFIAAESSVPDIHNGNQTQNICVVRGTSGVPDGQLPVLDAGAHPNGRAAALAEQGVEGLGGACGRGFQPEPGAEGVALGGPAQGVDADDACSGCSPSAVHLVGDILMFHVWHGNKRSTLVPGC